MVKLIIPMLIVLFISGCMEKSNIDDTYVVKKKDPEYCINGWKAYRYSKGYTMYLNDLGNPEPCDFRLRNNAGDK